MNRPVVIVNPLSSGIELAPAFKARGVPAIAVTLKPLDWNGFGATIQGSDFIEIIPNQTHLIELLRDYDPLAIIPGTEEGVPLAETLTLALTSQFANDPTKAPHRIHKALMQKALQEAGVPVLKTFDTSSENEVETWIKSNGLIDSPLICIFWPKMNTHSD